MDTKAKTVLGGKAARQDYLDTNAEQLEQHQPHVKAEPGGKAVRLDYLDTKAKAVRGGKTVRQDYLDTKAEAEQQGYLDSEGRATGDCWDDEHPAIGSEAFYIHKAVQQDYLGYYLSTKCLRPRLPVWKQAKMKRYKFKMVPAV